MLNIDYSSAYARNQNPYVQKTTNVQFSSPKETVGPPYLEAEAVDFAGQQSESLKISLEFFG